MKYISLFALVLTAAASSICAQDNILEARN